MDVAVIGGGISGLATAFALQQEARARGQTVDLRVFEADDRLGGKVDTRPVEGFVVEGGVNGWLDSKPSTEALCRELGIFEERLVSNDSSRRRFIWRNGRLHVVPTGPAAFLRSGLLSWRGKARVLGELWASPPPQTDETLASFARRRLGTEALEALLDPMVSGIFAGDPDRMSLRSSFPRIAEIEQEYGGLIRGLMAIQKQKRRERREGKVVQQAGPAGPGGRLVSFHGGTSRLIDALRGALDTQPQTGKRLQKIEAMAGGYRLLFANGEATSAERVVLATPAWSSARVLAELDGDLSRELKEIPYAAAAVVALGWKIEDVPLDLNGFGFLIPHREGREILGTLWDSSVFDHRAPEGMALTRTIVGGMRRGELALRPESQIVESVRRELRHIIGVSAVPELVHVVRHERAIPQYVLGHEARLQRLDARLNEHPGLFLTGNAYRGVGLNDCTANAKRVAAAVFASGLTEQEKDQRRAASGG